MSEVSCSQSPGTTLYVNSPLYDFHPTLCVNDLVPARFLVCDHITEMSSLTTSKRSACDRCRVHKLRCPPRDPGATSCARCLRLGAECITSFPRPPGRNAKNNDHDGVPRASMRSCQSVPDLRRKMSNPRPPLRLSADSRIQMSAPATAAPSAQSHNQIHNLQLSQARSHMDDPALFSPSFSFSDNSQDIFKGTTALYGDSLMFLTDVSHHDLDDALLSLDTGSALVNGQIEKDDLCHPTSPQADPSAFQADKSPSPGCIETDTRLSSLLLDLSRCLEHCMKIATSPDVVMLDVPSTLAAGMDGANPGSISDSNLLVHALGDLSEFLLIVQSYASRKSYPPSDSQDSSNGAGGDDSRSSSPGGRIGTIVLLNILSAYLQIVAIYDILMHYLGEKITDGSPDAMMVDSRGGPGGFPSRGHMSTSFSSQQQQQQQQQGNFQTRILIHAILHQFGTIETVLGLPAEFRVTDTPKSFSTGLFEDEGATGLLQALGLASASAQLQSLLSATSADRLEMRALPSLKHSIRNIQAYLGM
ncbi:hypothetical protein BX600DRAFT_441774 [Xylariales sp. PMI_506]|nr:hypothetical protein BX600DRAFT_441774 [Xylariales sp. PMI_506]